MPATRSHRTKKQNEFPCQYQDCGKTFSRTYDLQRHERIHCDYDSRRFGCKVDGCNFRANQLAGLKVHENSIHKGIRLPCDFPGCDRTFSDPSSRSKHRQRFHNQGPEGEQSGEGEAEESAPRLEEVPQDVPRYSPEGAIPPVPQYWPMASRSGSHGVAVPARVVRHIEEHSGEGAPDVLSQFAAFALREAAAIVSSAPDPSDDDSDTESVSAASTSSKRSRRAESSSRLISRSASSIGASSVTSSSAVPSSAVSPAPTSTSSLPTPTHMPSPTCELSGVLPSACNVATDVNIAQRTQMADSAGYDLNANIYAAPHLQLHAEPDCSQRWIPTTTIHQFKNHHQQYAYQPYGLSITGEDYNFEAFTQFQPSTVVHHQFQPQSQHELAPTVKQEEWIQLNDNLQIEAMNFNYSTMAYDVNNDARLYATYFQGSDASGVSYDSLGDANFWSHVDFEDPQAFDQLAVQALDIDKALENVQPKSPTPGVQMQFPVMINSQSHGVLDPLGMQGFYA